MRLIRDDGNGNLILVEKHDSDIPRYAILSHTWGAENEEVTYKDLTEGTGGNKAGYDKIEFCRKQAARDELEYFWVDTCCIDKSSSAELSEAINSMFRWYRSADKCYVYLTDVSTSGDVTNVRSSPAIWETAFRSSRWFTRGWTLQELVAPTSLEFFSREGDRLGSKTSLEQEIHEITKIAIEALRGRPLTDFEVEERFSWASHRETKRQEDKAYSLLGIFDIHMSLRYGEGREEAIQRLQRKISKSSKPGGDRAEVHQPHHLVAGNPLTMLEIAEEAAFDAIGRDHDPLCLPGTRIDLLRNIRGWLDSDNPKHIYWLSGLAGTGKSTIARTIAQEYTNSQWQLGSFFFSKGGGDAGHIHKFVGTVAIQLSYRWPAYKSALQKAIAADEGIVRRTQKAQWAALIQKPLSELLARSSLPRVLLVIDAVDECGTDDDMTHIIELLLNAREVNQTALRIFVTSRPEVAIRNGFNHDLDRRHLNLVLHQISESVVQNDLFIFLRHQFTEIRQSYRLGADWPGDNNIHRLVAMSGNLFIWAATVCRFISKGGRLVNKRLSSILERSHHSGGPETALDRIYLMVLEGAIGYDLSEEEKAEVTHHVRLTLGTIAVLFAPSSVVDLAHILGVETGEIEQTLADLHSIFDIPSDTDCPIRLHHPSFRDFLCDQNRCRNKSLCVDKTATHSMLANRSLNMMSILRRDICDLRSPGTIVEDVEPTVIQQHLSSALQYSCRYWLDHSEHGQLSLNDDGPVHRFLQEYCPYWLEAMSLVGKIPEATTMMTKLESLIDEKKAPALQSLVRDTLRFTQTFSHVLSIAPLQLYSAGVIFSPSSSVLRRSLGEQALGDIKVMTQVPEYWNACIQTLEGHSKSVNSVVFSSDGSRVASGSDDNTVQVWNVQTGQCEHTLEGHSGVVSSVVFSPDGSRVISGSSDNTVRVWDVQTGRCKHTLKGHLYPVTSVMFSLDGLQVASGSWDSTVRVWNVQTGQCKHELEGHAYGVNSVTFSCDGSRVASGSDDSTVRVWDVQTGQCEHTLKGHSSRITSVVFSSDGSQVASGSEDYTVRVWNVQTGQCADTLKGHLSRVTSVVFSSDGSRVASGSSDNTVRVWNAQTGQCEHALKGHSRRVSSVVFSSDGSRVASGSSDQTVRVWDVQTGQCKHTLEGHSGVVSSVVFSPDGSRVTSGSWDSTVRVWDVQTGRFKYTLEGHSGGVTSIVFSPDGSQVASGSKDNTVRVWDVQTGGCKHTLKGHSGFVNSVVFSPDGSRVASGSWDTTVRVWDVASTTELRCYDSESYYQTINFGDDGANIVVDGISLSIPSQTQLRSTTAESPGPPSELRVSTLEIRNDWITLSSNTILWLPPEYRPGRWANYGDTIVIGSETGRVTFVRCVAACPSSS